MNQITTSQPLNKAHDRSSDSVQGSALFFVLFIALLPVAFLAAVTGWRWQPWPPGNQGYRTFINEAKIAARVAAETALSF